jgi:hypothetical protein
MKGFIKLHRQIMDWEWYRDPNTKAVFIHILLNACYDQCRFMGTDVSRGQYITSLNRLSSDINVSVRQVRTALNRLMKTGEIDMQSTNKFTIITVCKYESYQVEDKPKKKRATSKRQANDTQPTSKRQAVDTQPTDINKKERKEERQNISIYERVKEQQIWRTQVAMHNNISIDKTLAALERFTNHLEITADTKHSEKDFKTHFVNWLKYNLEDVKSNTVAGNYKWKWKGQAMKTGTKEEFLKDKSLFDKAGFDFKAIS